MLLSTYKINKTIPVRSKQGIIITVIEFCYGYCCLLCSPIRIPFSSNFFLILIKSQVNYVCLYLCLFYFFLYSLYVIYKIRKKVMKMSFNSSVSLLSRVRLFATPWTVAHQAPPSMGFSRQEYWSGLPFPSPGHLPDPGIEPRSPTLQADALTSERPGKPEQTRDITKNPLVRIGYYLRN